MSAKFINVFIDEKPSSVPLGYTIMQSCTQVGIDIPKFCYHDKLLIAGNCRICLVELTGSKKLLASCAVHISENSYVYTNTARVKLARQNVLEFLLANHPLDCPICDQGGECDLQDITAVFGADRGRFYESEKRAVLNKDFGPLIRTSMNRCIHCTRCVRFLSFSSGMSVLGTLGRGSSTEIGAYVDKFLHDELSGNITDLCPVGALTSKPYSFKARPWELVSSEGLDTFDALNSNLIIDIAANKICRVLPYANEFTNSSWLTNRARYAYDGLFFPRLNSCLLRVNFLKYFNFNAFKLISRFTNFFIKLSWSAAISVFLNKLFGAGVYSFIADVGGASDLETVATSSEFVSLLGGRSGSYYQVNPSFMFDLTNVFIFNSSLLDLAKLPSFCLFLGTNPRFESPLINLKLTKLQLDFSVPFYRIGASISYYSYPVRIISNSIRSFFEICEFRHTFCKNFYTKNFVSHPFFLISAQLTNSVGGSTILTALFSLLKRLLHFSPRSFSTFFGLTNEFQNFSILGLYSSWIHRCDLAVGFSTLNFNLPQAAFIDFNRTNEISGDKFLYYGINSDSNFLLQLSASSKFFWTVYQGSHGSGIAALANLILPTTTHVERSVFYRNLLGMLQVAAPAVIYSKIPRTDTEIFREILTAASEFLFNRFFRFNFARAVSYNFSLDLAGSYLVSLSVRTTLNQFLRDVCETRVRVSELAVALSKSYYYNFTYWSYFSYNWKLANKGNLVYLNFFLSFTKQLFGSAAYFKPIASSSVNYYADTALPILTASKSMNTCSSLYLKKNLSVLQLHL